MYVLWSSVSLGGSVAQANRLAPKVGSCMAFVLHSSDEPGELSQWLCHDDKKVKHPWSTALSHISVTLGLGAHLH